MPYETLTLPLELSEYKLSKALPKELKSNLPTIEEIETELNIVKKPKSKKISKGKTSPKSHPAENKFSVLFSYKLLLDSPRSAW